MGLCVCLFIAHPPQQAASQTLPPQTSFGQVPPSGPLRPPMPPVQQATPRPNRVNKDANIVIMCITGKQYDFQ